MERVCKKCGRRLGSLEDDFDGLCFECNEKSSYIETEFNPKESNLSENLVAKKFTLVVKIKKFIGYLVAIIVLIASIKEDSSIGIYVGIGIASFTWFSTLLFEAIAEGLNLLEEIRNK